MSKTFGLPLCLVSAWSKWRTSEAHISIEKLISFKGAHYPKSVILYAVYFYVRFAVSYRNLEEIMAERAVDVNHATLNRWVEKYSSAITVKGHRRKAQTGQSWRMDETYVKVKSRWMYLYRAIDKWGNTLDFMLSERRNEAAATAFFAKAIASNGWPDKVVIEKSGSNAAGLFNMNCLLVMHNWYCLFDVLQVKYLNNIIEQDHRFIKKISRSMQTFKSFNSAAATLASIEVAHMIRKEKFDLPGKSGFEQFAEFAG
jgi:putative transposase